MRFLSTLFYMILTVIGIIISINIFAYIMCFFIIKKEQKGKIVYLYMLLLIAVLILAALFASYFKYIYLYKTFFILSMLFLLMLAIIIANNSILDSSTEYRTHYKKDLTKSNSKNGHSTFYNLLAFFGLFYLFHEVFYDDDNDDSHFNNEDFHDSDNDYYDNSNDDE